MKWEEAIEKSKKNIAIRFEKDKIIHKYYNGKGHTWIFKNGKPRTDIPPQKATSKELNNLKDWEPLWMQWKKISKDNHMYHQYLIVCSGG